MTLTRLPFAPLCILSSSATLHLSSSSLTHLSKSRRRPSPLAALLAMWPTLTARFGHRPAPPPLDTSQLPHSSARPPPSSFFPLSPMAPPSQTQEAPPVPSFANDISPFPPSQYSSPPPGGPPSLEPQVGFGSFFTSQPQRAARAQSRAVRTFGKAQEESDPRMRGYVEPPAGQGRTTPVMLPPSLPAQNHATPAFFRPWPPPGPSQQQYGPHVVDSYHPAQHAGTSISRSRGPASVTSGRASRADTPSVRAPSMDRGKPRTAAEVYMAGTQAKTTMGDKVMSAIDGQLVGPNDAYQLTQTQACTSWWPHSGGKSMG